MVSLFHSHGQKDASEDGVNNSRRNLFDERMESVKMKYGKNPVRKSCKRHSQGNAKVCWQVVRGGEGMVSLSRQDIVK